MLVLHRQQFRIAEYHRQQAPADADSELTQGLVVEVSLEFEKWLGGQPLQAEAFLDPGADSSTISRRWIRDQAQAVGTAAPTPWVDPDGIVLEQTHLTIGGWRVPLGDPRRPLWVFEQQTELEQTGSIPGYEDLLLGRDFLSQYDLLLVIDGRERSFSLLAPVDTENRNRRSKILEALSDRPE